MAAALIGKINYRAGVSGTVVLDSGEKLVALWAVATTSGGYVSINGGDHIPLVAGVPFSFGNETRTEEWVTATIVFSGTASYFMKTLKHYTVPT